MIAIDAPFAQIIKETDGLAASLQEPSAAADIRRDGLIGARTLPKPDKRLEAWRRSNPEWFLPELSRPFVLAEDEISIGFLAGASEWQKDFQELGINLLTEEKDAKQRIEFAEGAAADTPELTALSMNRALKRSTLPPAGFFRAEQHQKDLACALNAALRTGGAYVSLKPEASLEQPLYIKHRAVCPQKASSEEQSLFFSHSLIEASRPCRAVVIEDFTCAPAQALKAHNLTEIDLSQGAELTYVMIGGWDEAVSCLNTLNARLGRDAALKVIFIGLGGSLTKTFFSADLNQPGARTQIYGTVAASGRQLFDNDTFIHHKAPSCYSDVLFNCAVDDRARSVFAGNILVDGCAQLTDAYQKNQNLLLSPEAKAESMPKLEIIADDVRCTHGASFTEYDENQLFYLQSRGLSEREAKAMLTEGFFREVIEKTGCALTADWLSRRIADKLTRS